MRQQKMQMDQYNSKNAQWERRNNQSSRYGERRPDPPPPRSRFGGIPAEFLIKFLKFFWFESEM